MSEDLTHYDVLRVEPSADKDAIKSAYQERLAEVQGDVEREQGAKKPDQSSLDGYRREEASVRSAWQVLSDPYQRGRYDATIEMVGEGSGASDDGEDDAPVPARGPATDRRGRPIRERPPGLFSTEPLPVPSSWPAGLHPPPPRARVLAMTVDMFVLGLIFFVGIFLVAPAVLEQAYPKETDKLELVNDCQDRLAIEENADSTSRTDIARAEAFCDRKVPGMLASASKREGINNKDNRLEDDVDRADERAQDVRGKIALGTYGLQFGLIAIMLLYLVPSSVRTGRTLGKRLFQIRAVYADGSPLTTRGAIARYGSVVLAAMFLGSFIFPLGFALVLFGVLAWPRNANLQGLHDRMAKTIVVDG